MIILYIIYLFMLKIYIDNFGYIINNFDSNFGPKGKDCRGRVT